MLDKVSFLANFDYATMLAVFVLSFYSIIALAIFIYRFSYLNSFHNSEFNNLKKLLLNQNLSYDAYFSPCSSVKQKLLVYKNEAEKKLSEGITWLSIIATTSPFIGLFGTVISIYITLIGLSSGSNIDKIANPIGHALIATAFGIISAVCAYTFHLILKRKIFECLSILDSQMDLIVDEK